MKKFKLGLIVNPRAGIGGPAGLKGSDGADIQAQALARGSRPKAGDRCLQSLRALAPWRDRIVVSGYAGDMAETAAVAAGLEFEAIGSAEHSPTTAADTVVAARLLQQRGVDLLLFAGGDGTARDICAAVGDRLPALGVPAGVKMHSGVYAISPAAAGELIARLVQGGLVDVQLAEVRDIDEDAFREGVVRSRYFGELLVPRSGRFLQHVKDGGREVEALAVADIGADVVEAMQSDTLYILGPGSTTRAVMEELRLDNTLLGVDAVLDRQLVGQDLDATALTALLASHPGPKQLLVTAIGGQGHVLGRGNQQLTPSVLRQIGIENIQILATKGKIARLEGRPLLVDSGDPQIDAQLSGYRRVITGYHDAILYPLGLDFAEAEEAE